MKIAFILVFSLMLPAAAYAQFACGSVFFSTGICNGGLAVPLPTGKILLVDGTSFILQTDGVSKICRAGGC